FSVVVTTDRDAEAAQRIGREMCAMAWARRAGMTTRFEPLAQSIARAKALTARPVLLVDHADNCNSGGSQDTMEVIAEALAQGLEEIAAGPICDPAAVALMVAAGIGARVEVAVGGKHGIPAIGRPGRPLRLSGVVRKIADGRFTVEGPVFTGMRATLGRTVLLDTGPLLLVVSEGRMEPLDLGMFRCVGIEPVAQRFLIIKSKVQYRPTFGAMAKRVVLCNGVGAASADFGLFRFARLRRPIYPLDADAEYAACSLPNSPL
ncbi:MAG: MlrC C-terminal domain-containing protein, partial [Bradyrhizobium sp.]